jgi:trans-AT polyketide synthase/acyltransferase/oxidoreductase domain-containing protein
MTTALFAIPGAPSAPLTPEARAIAPGSLGDSGFKNEYGLRYAYVAGAMYKGIASAEMVVKLGRSRLLAFLGTGGMRLDEMENNLRAIRAGLPNGEPYGSNLLCNLAQPAVEASTVDLLLKHGIRNVEAAAFIQVTPAVAKFRLKGAKRNAQGEIEVPNRVMAKVSRPEVAEAFMSPVPEQIRQRLLQAGEITAEEAEVGARIPVAWDVCVEADSGGHTDQGVALALMPAMFRLRDDMMARHRYPRKIRVGAAGGIGTPHAAAAAFVMGADFILTGSINQCTVEAGTSDSVKDMLQEINVQDTAYAPAGDMFEIGARVQVLKKGLFFPARANKLYELYTRHGSIEEIDENTRRQIQEKYFKRSFADVWEETKTHYLGKRPEEIEKAERNPKQKMALIFKWYFVHTSRLALQGSKDQRVDYQVHTGPALGAFNQWVKGTPLESWRNRRVEDIAERLMQATAALLNERFRALQG